MIELGVTVRDKLTGFEGVAVGRHSYLTGCDRYTVQPSVLKDGVPQAAQPFDELQLTVVPGKEVLNFNAPTESAKKGGPRDDPGQRSF